MAPRELDGVSDFRHAYVVPACGRLITVRTGVLRENDRGHAAPSAYRLSEADARVDHHLTSLAERPPANGLGRVELHAAQRRLDNLPEHLLAISQRNQAALLIIRDDVREHPPAVRSEPQAGKWVVRAEQVRTNLRRATKFAPPNPNPQKPLDQPDLNQIQE
ncbi:MAG: hypothetical protein AB7K52_09155 [Phycisphaerales bacterium]